MPANLTTYYLSLTTIMDKNRNWEHRQDKPKTNTSYTKSNTSYTKKYTVPATPPQEKDKTNRPPKTTRIQYDNIRPSDFVAQEWDENAATLPVETARVESDFIYGRHPVLEGLQRGDEFEKIMLQQGTRGEFEKEVRGICRDRNIPLQIVPKEKLQSYTQKNHQGVIGITSPLAYQELETIFEAVKAKNEIPMFVLLDAVTDVRNIGAIARSAEISGVHALVVSKKNVASINAEAMKASAGALNLLSVCRVSSLMAAVEYLQAQGVQVVAAEMEAKKLVRHVDFSLPTAVVMGAEGRGINNDLLRKMNETFRIPMLGKTESFNVSVATGIVLYEAMRQRCD
jgi:23S rRNA (guanosine2251-2'-O)-methyltransferase